MRDFRARGAPLQDAVLQNREEIRLHPAVVLFKGSSHSLEYRLWRERQQPFDLVLIDADHTYDAVRRDFQIHRALGDRFLAFHDIWLPSILWRMPAMP